MPSNPTPPPPRCSCSGPTAPRAPSSLSAPSVRARALFSHPDTPAPCHSAGQPEGECAGEARLTQAPEPPALKAERALRVPVSLLVETEEVDLRKQPEPHAEGLRGERSRFKGAGSSVPPSLSRRLRVPCPLDSVALHTSPWGSSPVHAGWRGGPAGGARQQQGSLQGCLRRLEVGDVWMGRSLWPARPFITGQATVLTRQVPFPWGVAVSWSFLSSRSRLS